MIFDHLLYWFLCVLGLFLMLPSPLIVPALLIPLVLAFAVGYHLGTLQPFRVPHSAFRV